MMTPPSPEVVFSLFYGLFCAGLVLQFGEFASVGLSPENLLHALIRRSEDLQPVEFHLRKSAFTVVLHASLPFGFVVGNAVAKEEFFSSAFLLAASLPLIASVVVAWWAFQDWARHPMAQKLRRYNADWRRVAANIDTELRRVDKFTGNSSPISKVVVTDSWLCVFGQWPWSFHVARQNEDAFKVEVVSSDSHDVSVEQRHGAQFLDIRVSSSLTPEFRFRLNALDYQNLKDKIGAPILNVNGVRIAKSVGERFVEVFREQVAKNPKATSVDDEDDFCVGCMLNRAEVKLVRRCGSMEGCVSCGCRPMWCVDCMARWFASRMNEDRPDTWLGSRCPCPTCRSPFCVLDVSIIE